ncbi:ATP-dependent DNA helicase [Candidatus Woesearchaeota archaeon]|nr:ATP-dependent DNA helicase [Candidatus Woesearchaeota archaeon]
MSPSLPTYWPYDKVRPEQDKLIDAVKSTVTTKQSLVAHAPTGLGKTVAVLAPALEAAMKKDLVVIFMSGRHTQHEIAMQTAKEIKEKHNLDFTVVDLIGKRWLCLQQGVDSLQSRGFAEYCKAMKADKQCAFYENLKQGEDLSAKTKQLLKDLSGVSPLRTDEVKAAAKKAELCPYEVTLLLAKNAKLIVTDYLYLFDPGIRKLFLARIGKTLDQCILVVDEAHNLPERVKDIGSDKLSTLLLNRAIAEAEKYKHDELAAKLKKLNSIIQKMALFTDKNGNPVDGEAEKYVTKDSFTEHIEKVHSDIEALQEWMEKIADSIREEQRSSYIGGVAQFLWLWEEAGETGMARIVKRERGMKEWVLTLHNRCLDPSIITHEVFENCHSAILMSGTLTPPGMYASLLGVSEPNLLMLESPFPEENRLNIIIPKTSTKFTQRSDKMWQDIADVLKKVVMAVPGNIAVFFPSYAILENVQERLDQGLPKTVLGERRGMTKDEKQVFLNRFRDYKATGAVLLGVISGNYGEGIDLPGDELKGVVVVGLPLTKPDLETDALIKYYDSKFRKGWEYGYTIPAFNKTLQSAGRCIRSSTDKGVVVFLDERYEWPNYFPLFPNEWHMKSTLLYEKMIKDFFEKNGN